MCCGVHAGRRLHHGERQHLHDVVLHDVAQRAGRLVEAAAVLDADALGHGDLHLLDVAAVPDRLEDGVGEAQRQDVLHRLFAHVVVDAEDLVLVEGAVHGGVERRARSRGRGRRASRPPGGRRPPPSPGWLHPSLASASATSGEQRGDGGQVVEAVARGPVRLVGLGQQLPQLVEGGRSPRTRRRRSGSARPASFQASPAPGAALGTAWRKSSSLHSVRATPIDA